jgi:hypothetical protein
VGKGQLSVRWDTGSTLSMLLHDGDRVRLITPARERLGPDGDEPACSPRTATPGLQALTGRA